MLKPIESAAKGWLIMRAGMLALALGLLTLGFLPALPAPWCLLLFTLLGVALLPTRAYPLAFFLFGLSWSGKSAKFAT